MKPPIQSNFPQYFLYQLPHKLSEIAISFQKSQLLLDLNAPCKTECLSRNPGATSEKSEEVFSDSAFAFCIWFDHSWFRRWVARSVGRSGSELAAVCPSCAAEVDCAAAAAAAMIGGDDNITQNVDSKERERGTKMRGKRQNASPDGQRRARLRCNVMELSS